MCDHVNAEKMTVEEVLTCCSDFRSNLFTSGWRCHNEVKSFSTALITELVWSDNAISHEIGELEQNKISKRLKVSSMQQKS